MNITTYHQIKTVCTKTSHIESYELAIFVDSDGYVCFLFGFVAIGTLRTIKHYKPYLLIPKISQT